MTNSIRQTTACDIAGARRRVGGTVVTYWVLHGTETTRDRVVAEFDRYGIAVGAGGDWTVTNAGGGVVVESASDRPVVESLQGTSDADIEAYVARIVAVLAGQQSAEDIAGIGHVLLDKIEETRAERDQARDERNHYAEMLDDAVDELADAQAECERLRRVLKGKNFALWGELSMQRARTEAATSRRLVGLMREYPDAEAAFDVFHEVLTASIDAKIAAEARAEGEVA